MRGLHGPCSGRSWTKCREAGRRSICFHLDELHIPHKGATGVELVETLSATIHCSIRAQQECASAVCVVKHVQKAAFN